MIKPKVKDINKIKEKTFIPFAKLIQEQLKYGGQKYEQDEERESIDVLMDIFGVDAGLKDITKYILRFRNLQRERDLIKAATYCYICWLKMGYAEPEGGKHDSDIPQTNS